jgi:HK97 family phage prohead protease
MKDKSLPTGREVRSMPVRELRADDDTRRIVGYAAVFDSDADLGFFEERIAFGAFSRAIDEDQDVRALWNHDANYVLGRTKSKTLTMAEDKVGLRIEIDPPDTQTARDFVESIRRGDVDQMSFAFRAVKESWTEREGELPLRELHDVDLFDVSPVTYPAYEATSVGVRSAEDIYQEHIQSVDAQECEADGDDDETVQECGDRQRRLNWLKLKLNWSK